MKRPNRLEIGDLPRDPNRALGGLRKTLCASFNYVRRYPLKWALLREVLETTLKKMDEYETTAKALEEQQKETAVKTKASQDKLAALKLLKQAGTFTEKEDLDKFAEENGIKLDARKSLENMLAAFKEQLQAKLAEKGDK